MERPECTPCTEREMTASPGLVTCQLIDTPGASLELTAVHGGFLGFSVSRNGTSTVYAAPLGRVFFDTTGGSVHKAGETSREQGGAATSACLLIKHTSRICGLQLFRASHRPNEQRMMAMFTDGRMCIWGLVDDSTHDAGETEGRQWQLLADSRISLQGEVMGISYEAASGRLMYIEEMRGHRGGAPPERLRVVSRSLLYRLEPPGPSDRDHPSGQPPHEILTIGCAVSVAQAEVHELHAIKMGSRGCWIIFRDHVSYNCFVTRRVVTMAVDEPAPGPERMGQTLYAHHAITEQLFVLQPCCKRLAVITYKDEELVHRVLHAHLKSLDEHVQSFAVHRNTGIVLASTRLLLYHLRSGQHWVTLPLPAVLHPTLPWRLSFWADRSGPTRVGLWCTSGALCCFKPAAAAEEQALLTSSSPSAATIPHLDIAIELSDQYGPSMVQAAAYRAFDRAHVRRERGEGLDRQELPLPIHIALALFEGSGHETRAITERALKELGGLTSELEHLSANPIIRSGKSMQRDEMVTLASTMRDRPPEVTPLLLALQHLLNTSLETECNATPRLYSEAGASDETVTRSSDSLAVELAERVCRADTAEGILTLWGLPGTSLEELGEEIVYRCCCGEDGVLEILSLLLYRVQPTLLMRLLRHLETMLTAKLGDGGVPEPALYHYRALYGYPSPSSTPRSSDSHASHRSHRTASFASPMRTPVSRTTRSVSSPLGRAIDETYIKGTIRGIEDKLHPEGRRERSPPLMDSSGKGLAEWQHQVRPLYLRALRLVEPPQDRQASGAQMSAFLALLEGAQHFVYMARYLTECGYLGEAVDLLDRLRSLPQTFCGLPHRDAVVNHIFLHLLETSLKSVDSGVVDIVITRRPPGLAPRELLDIADTIRRESGSLQLAALKRCLLSLLSTDHNPAPHKSCTA